MSKNFFEEFAKNDFFEKKASENENIKSTLDSITPGVLEKLAEEIGAISDFEDMTLEQKLAEEDKESESEDKEDKESESKDKETESEDKEDKEAECEDKEDEEDKEAECEDKKDEEDKEAECDSDSVEDKEPKKENPDQDDKEEENNEDNKEAGNCSSDEEEVKKAYEIAEERLASAGFTIADYIYEKTASESVALFISENAEKLASLSDKATLQVADEILSVMAEKLG